MTSLQAQHGIVRVEKVNLPHYDVVYRTADFALRDARAVHESRVFLLYAPINELVGSDIVLDLSVDDLPVRATLLFRFIGARDGAAVMEWVPRRTRDPALLDLWIASLEHEPTRDVAAVRPEDDAARRRLLSLCRRLMSRNPFTALDVHWAAGDAEITQATITSRRELETLAGVADDPVARRFVEHGHEGIDHAGQHLGSVAARAAARSRFVPHEQLEHARSLARSKLEVARMRGDRDEADAQLRLMVELADG